jgi:23S rRNA pseudouridine1911/1915/1917 synthase
MLSFSCIAEDLPYEMRLDRYAAERLKLLTRSQVKARNLAARINGKPVKISHPVRNGDKIELEWNDAEPSELIPENIPLDALYEDENVIVINKAQGMVVHPGAGNKRGTVANALLYRRLNAGGLCAGENFRPGIVHRLDKDTSGVLIAAYNSEALAFLAEQFKTRKTKKLYAALVGGAPKEKRGVIQTRIARSGRDRKLFAVSSDRGKPAITKYKVLRTWEKSGLSLLALKPKTGRTHQLRVHLKHIGCPIIGDPLYGKPDPRFSPFSLMLHAKSLSITLPGAMEKSFFTTPLPERFIFCVKSLW